MFIKQIYRKEITSVDVNSLPEVISRFYNKAIYIYGEENVSIQYADESFIILPEDNLVLRPLLKNRVYVVIIKIGDVKIESHDHEEVFTTKHTILGTYILFTFRKEKKDEGYEIHFNISRDKLFNTEYQKRFTHPHVTSFDIRNVYDSEYLSFFTNACLGVSQLRLLLIDPIVPEDIDNKFYSILVLGKQFLETEFVDDVYRSLDEIYDIVDSKHLIHLNKNNSIQSRYIQIFTEYKSKLLPLMMQNVKFINNKIIFNKFISISKEFYNDFEISEIVTVKVSNSYYTRNIDSINTVNTDNSGTKKNLNLIFKDKPVILEIVQDIESNNELNNYNLYLNPKFVMQMEKYLNKHLKFML